MAYFWAWPVETDRKKKKRSPRRSRRPVAGKAVTRDRRVYGCCSLPFATSHGQQISTDLLDSHSRRLGGIERRPAFRALAYPASGGTNGFCCRRISVPLFWTFCLTVRELGPRSITWSFGGFVVFAISAGWAHAI